MLYLTCPEKIIPACCAKKLSLDEAAIYLKVSRARLKEFYSRPTTIKATTAEKLIRWLGKDTVRPAKEVSK